MLDITEEKTDIAKRLQGLERGEFPGQARTCEWSLHTSRHATIDPLHDMIHEKENLKNIYIYHILPKT